MHRQIKKNTKTEVNIKRQIPLSRAGSLTVGHAVHRNDFRGHSNIKSWELKLLPRGLKMDTAYPYKMIRLLRKSFKKS